MHIHIASCVTLPNHTQYETLMEFSLPKHDCEYSSESKFQIRITIIVYNQL